MEQHAVPRQITTFEFKLIGFLTLKQFGYLVLFSTISFILFYVVPIPFLNIGMAVIVAIAGVAVVFVPYNDRSLDVWVKNFFKKLFWPSQYYYIKRNQIPDFLKDVFVYSTPDIVEQHVDARQKLNTYLQTNNPVVNEEAQKQHIHELINTSGQPLVAEPAPAVQTIQSEPQITKAPPPQTDTVAPSIPTGAEPAPPPAASGPSKPFLFGVVKNGKKLPLPQILIYVKDASGNLLRILKTNHNGVFATYHALPENNYSFEIKDLGQKYFFDTMEIAVKKTNEIPIEFFSKEVL